MNKQQKIIVSIVGITIVLLALLGITYAYYLTRIEGNTNTNSISITTANLKLKYEDGNGLLTATNITPGKQVEFKTTGNETTTEKTFTVTNTGNSTIEGYAVSLDYAYIENVMPSIFERPEDFQITLTCTTNKTGESCNGFTGNFNNESIMMTSNDIEQDEVHTYSLSIYYNDPSLDQSNDMGKNLNLKVQIYNISETTDIEGTITGVDSKYSVKIESEPKMSTIINGKYNFKGVEIGTHTLTILDKDGNEVDKEYIVVKNGTPPGINTTKATIDNNEVDATEITITSEQRLVKLVTKVESNVLSFDTNTSSTEIFNPYSNNKNSLAYNIINNAKTNKNKTTFSTNPLTKPAEQISGVTSYKTTGKEPIFIKNMSSISGNASKTWYYYDTYIVDKTTGRFTLSGKRSCTYNSTTTNIDGETVNCYEDIANKYLYDHSASNNTYAGAHTANTKTGLEYVYKVTSATTTTLNYVRVNNIADEAERILTTTTDDYGISYYFRGAVDDNYVNFAGMCWRIVRIAGDGSTKLILEDQYTTCNNTIELAGEESDYYTGNWVIGTGNHGYETKNVDSDSSNEKIMNYLNPTTSKTLSMVKSFYDFQTNSKLKDYTSKLKAGGWCLGDKAYTQSGSRGSYTHTPLEIYNRSSSMYYDSYTRLTSENANGYQPTLKCNGTILNEYADVTGVSSKNPMYVSAITADEIVYAGGKYGERNYNYYIVNDYSKSNGSFFWTLSPYNFHTYNDNNSDYDTAFSVYGITGSMSVGVVYNDSHDLRPVISLSSNVNTVEGDGTISNPYVVE